MYLWYDPIQSETQRTLTENKVRPVLMYTYLDLRQHSSYIGALLNQEALIHAAGSRVELFLRTFCVGCSEEFSLMCPRPLRSLGHWRWSVAMHMHTCTVVRVKTTFVSSSVLYWMPLSNARHHFTQMHSGVRTYVRTYLPVSVYSTYFCVHTVGTQVSAVVVFPPPHFAVCY